jgi:hypothetical protein
VNKPFDSQFMNCDIAGIADSPLALSEARMLSGAVAISESIESDKRCRLCKEYELRTREIERLKEKLEG